MQYLKSRLGRWTMPAMLAAVVAAALAVSPAIGALKFVTGKKVIKTITKKTNATSIRVAGTKTPANSISDGSAVLATLPVSRGPVVVSSTFTMTKDTSGLALSCRLRVQGVGEDQTDFFGPTGAAPGQIQVPGSMSVAGTSGAPTSAQLLCADGNAAADSRVKDIEITAIRLPKVTSLSG